MENTDIRIYELEEYLPIYKIADETEKASSDEVEGIELLELKKYFSEDMEPEMLKNITEEKLVRLVKRYRSIVNKKKKECGCRCQICGLTFQMDNGNYYCEAHHLIPISEDGSQGPENVIILCANHHRVFHYAKNNINIREENGEKIISIDGVCYRIAV